MTGRDYLTGLSFALLPVTAWITDIYDGGFWDAVFRYQTLLAGIFAVIAAGLGAFVVWQTTNKRIEADHTRERNRIETEWASERERRDREATAISHALAGEFEMLRVSCMATREGLQDATGDYRTWAETAAMGVQKPTDTVYKGVIGQLGLLGGALSEEVARVSEIWDSFPRTYLTIAKGPKLGTRVSADDVASLSSALKKLEWRAARLARALRSFSNPEAIQTILSEVNPHKKPEGEHD